MIFNKRNSVDKSVAAIKYNDRIIIETRNSFKEGGWYSTDNFTILPIDSTEELIGGIILKQLDASVEKNIPHVDIRSMRANYMKKANFKSNLGTMKDARFVGIILTDKYIRFEPTQNKYSDGVKAVYSGMPDDKFEIPVTKDFVTIGRNINEVWTRCIFK